jgi:predicted glycoside hydrolase/deacetylase ChbG (UPF0249 family)
MRILFLITLAVLNYCLFAQTNPPKLIVRGDDMGYSHSGNEALIKCFNEGIETSIEVIVPSPWFPEAVKMLEANPSVDVGIHLAITSEWDNVKWRPLTDCKSIKDPDGYFYPMIWANKNYPGRAITDNAWKIEDVEKEFRAQIELAKKKIPRVSHLSSHMGCTRLDQAVTEMTKKLAKEYSLTFETDGLNVQGISYNGPHKTLEEKIESFKKMLGSLEADKTYLFVDHPGLDSPELKAVSHIGYEDVAIDRQGVTTLWTSDEIKSLIKSKGIQLVSYKDVVKSK